MRELIFRVWTGLNYEYDVMVGRFGVFYVNPTNDGLDALDSASLSPLNTKYPDSITIEQYTGLKDKNGKKIFEGDILKGDYAGARIGVIQFARGVFGINWDYKYNQNPEWDGGNMYGTWGHLHNLRPLDDDHVNHMCIIGNIHENADLLEGK